jgi:hypothetical protein
MNYLKVSIIEDPSIVYEIHDEALVITFTDALGNVIQAPEVTHYTSRNAVTNFEPWMQLPTTPALSTNITKLEFLQRFTADERIAIRTAAKSNPALEDFMELLNAAQSVDTTFSETVAGLQTFEQVGLLAAGRANQILGV